MAGVGGSGQDSGDVYRLTASGVWKGENESDAELMESYESNPLDGAGAWTEDEAYRVYREKLVALRDHYMDQLGHLRHVLQEKRREFLLQDGGNRAQASIPSHGGSLEDAAYRCYHKSSGEEALLKRRQKQRRIGTSLDFFLKRESRDTHKTHYQYLLKLHHQQGPSLQPACTSSGCSNQCLPFASRCYRHVCDDPKQLLYTRCSYVYPSGVQCSKPVPSYWEPPLCGGHCDSISVPVEQNESSCALDKSDDGGPLLGSGEQTGNIDSNSHPSSEDRMDSFVDSEVKR